MGSNNMATPDLTPEKIDDQEAADAALISKLISGEDTDLNDIFAVSHAHEEEKAEDAVDYEDIEDDDLPDEEEPAGSAVKQEVDEEDDFMKGLMDEGAAVEGGHDADGDAIMDHDLFGDDEDHGGAAEDHVDMFGDRPVTPPPNQDIKSEQTSPYARSIQQATYDDTYMDMTAVPKTREECIQEAMELFPGFAPNKRLRFQTLLPPKTAKYVPKLTREPKRLLPSKPGLQFGAETEKFYRYATMAPPPGLDEGRRIYEVPEAAYRELNNEEPSAEMEEDESEESEEEDAEKKLQLDLEMICQDWEGIEGDASQAESAMVVSRENFADGRPSKRLRLLPRYIDDLNPSWPKTIEETPENLYSKVVLDLNDPDLLVDVVDQHDATKARRVGKEFRRLGNKAKQDFLHQRYNISNDDAYDALKENHQNKVRSTLSELEVIHALPALRLQTPYYKTRLNIKEKRNFHRPQLHLPPGLVMRFSKIKPRKKRTYRGMNPQDVLKSTADLSLNDYTNFVLFEYSEEHPIVLSNFGMGSRIINYYRRKDPNDDERPKWELGETQVLMPQDRSPFWNFGFVEPGEVVPALCNKMVRAPIFKQQAKSTDFLVIRNTSAARGSTYHLRTIPNLYVVGQVFPALDVPGPHSRKVTNASRNRLKMVCYRVLKRKDEKAIAVKDISEHFPENNDMQSRQKMKEFMSYHKEKGLWEMKPGEQVPDEAALRALVTPETVCLLESMQVGVQHLEDAGYGKGIDIDDDPNDKDEGSIEQQMAPWVITRNFIEATQGKAMLKLYGEGDPSGRGEAFSFIRTSMKGGFKAIGESVEEKMDKARLKELGGHSYNVAKQQKSYEDAILKIWKSQQASLSNTEERDDLDMAEYRRDDVDPMEDGRTPRSEARTPGYFGGNHNDDDSASQFSRISGTGQGHKVMRITRQVRNEFGQLETTTEIIRDPKVIRQYKARRALRLSQTVPLEDFKPTGNADQDKEKQRLLQAELDRLLNNRERRFVREKQRKKKTGEYGSPDINSPMSPSAGDGMGGKNKQATTRKCTSCGLVGHIRTNKKLCPNQNPDLAKQMGWNPEGSNPTAMSPTAE